MGVRAFQARVECDAATLQQLWRTHCVFNERLRPLLKLIFKMRRGECGDDGDTRELYRTIAQFIVHNSQNAEYLLNSVSIPNWTPKAAKKCTAELRAQDGAVEKVTGETWADNAAELSKRGKLLFAKSEWLGDLPGAMRQMICRECAAIIRGHEELTNLWTTDHQGWLDRKADWEADEQHKLYLALRPQFEAFEVAVGGKAAKRRGRWHLYLQWLRENPALAAWRGGSPPVVQALSARAERRISLAKPWKKRAIEAEEFWKANPELAALDKLHGYYEREFVRRRKTKKNLDGFNHRPTFTLPEPTKHPRWFVFNAPQTNPSGYGRLALPATAQSFGSVELVLLSGEKADGKFPLCKKLVRFKADPRLSSLRSVKKLKMVRSGAKKGQAIEKDAFEFYDKHLRQWRPAEIAGAKLIFRDVRLQPSGALRSATPYLYFTCKVEDLPLTEKAKQIEFAETGELTSKGRPKKKRTVPAGLVALAVDLGVRHLGFATLAALENAAPRVLRSRNIWIGEEELTGRHAGRWSAGPDLAHVGAHKREIKRLRRKRGKPVRGEKSHVRLQEHITEMGEDRFKRAARAIINYALNVDMAKDKAGNVYPRADVLILERLAGLLPDAERERGINRRLIEWNRGQLVKTVRQMAADAGLKVREVSPVGTSQVCSKCGALGRRYTIVRDGTTPRPSIKFGWVEKLFACAACGYRANADHNASVNLHRRFLLDESAVSSFFAWRNSPKEVRDASIQSIEGTLLPALRAMHSLYGFSADSVPF